MRAISDSAEAWKGRGPSKGAMMVKGIPYIGPAPRQRDDG
jgi:hypothetical protein